MVYVSGDKAPKQTRLLSSRLPSRTSRRSHTISYLVYLYFYITILLLLLVDNCSMADTVRGDGLVRAERALAALIEDPQRLDRAIRRFSSSPPSYTSHQSHNSTLPQSPDPPSEEHQSREERQVQLYLERMASLPYEQFAAQGLEEQERIFEADQNRTCRVPVGTNYSTLAQENVKKRWVEQGIWNKKWNSMAEGRWKHQEPLEVECESETDSDTEPQATLFSFFPKKAEAKSRRSKNDEEKRQIAERQAAQKREREASRPVYQFFYQVSKERERIQDESGVEEATVPAPADINTRAYENVKRTWIKRGIWNRKWGILPGMTWKHEEPLGKELADDNAPVHASLLGNGSHEAGEAPITSILGSSPPIELDHRQASGIMNVFEQGRPANMDPAELENDEAQHSPLKSNSPRPRRSRRALCPTAGEAPRPSKRKLPHEGWLFQSLLSTSLGPVNSLKAPREKRRRRNASDEILSNDLPLSPGSDIAEPQLQPASITPRRSKRLQPPEPSMATDPTRVASTGSHYGVSLSKSKRIVGGNLKSIRSAKARGISNRQTPRTTRKRHQKDEN